MLPCTAPTVPPVRRAAPPSQVHLEKRTAMFCRLRIMIIALSFTACTSQPIDSASDVTDEVSLQVPVGDPPRNCTCDYKCIATDEEFLAGSTYNCASACQGAIHACN